MAKIAYRALSMDTIETVTVQKGLLREAATTRFLNGCIKL